MDKNKKARKIGTWTFLVIGIFLLLTGVGSIPLLIIAITVAIVMTLYNTRDGHSTDSYGNPM